MFLQGESTACTLRTTLWGSQANRVTDKLTPLTDKVISLRERCRQGTLLLLLPAQILLALPHTEPTLHACAAAVLVPSTARNLVKSAVLLSLCAVCC